MAENTDSNNNKYGLSKKTNIAIVAVTTIAAAQSSTIAISGIVVVALAGLFMQWHIDAGKKG